MSTRVLPFRRQPKALLEEPDVGVPHRPARILVADDDPSLLWVVAEALRADGHEVITVDDGEAVPGAMRCKPDLVILDRRMPGLSGDELLRIVRRSKGGESIPVLILSAIVEPGQRTALLRAGADDYLCKPCDMAELTARVDTLLRWKAAAAAPLLAAFGEKNLSLSEIADEVTLARSILDHLQLPPPEVPGMEIRHEVLAAHNMGGDFIEYYHDLEGKFLIAMGDVSGRGMTAALYTVMLRTMMRHLVTVGRHFSRILPEMNQFVLNEFIGARIASLQLLRLDVARGKWSLATAGAPPAIQCRAGRSHLIVAPGGPPLGVEIGREFAAVHGRLLPHDRFLLYSDGLLDGLRRGEVNAAIRQITDLLSRNPAPGAAFGKLKALLPNPLPDDVSLAEITIR